MATKKKAAEIAEEVKALARSVYIENAAMNAAKRAHDGARKELFARMINESIDPFDFDTQDAEGRALKLTVKTAAAEMTVMNVHKLRELVEDDDVFLKIVSATKKAIEELAGKDVAVMCEEKVSGALNVVVKPAA